MANALTIHYRVFNVKLNEINQLNLKSTQKTAEGCFDVVWFGRSTRFDDVIMTAFTVITIIGDFNDVVAAKYFKA